MLGFLFVPFLQDKLRQLSPPPATAANDPYPVDFRNSLLFITIPYPTLFTKEIPETQHMIFFFKDRIFCSNKRVSENLRKFLDISVFASTSRAANLYPSRNVGYRYCSSRLFPIRRLCQRPPHKAEEARAAILLPSGLFSSPG
jgi:hypothetical protein